MDALKAALVKTLLRLTSLLPLSVARWIGRMVGHGMWICRSKARRITEINIALAFPDMPPAQQRALARRSLLATGELTSEMGHVWLRGADTFADLVREVRGAELVTESVAQGRGVIVLGPHLGNWEVVGLHLAGLGPTVALYEPPRLSALGPMIEAVRERTGATLVPTDHRGIARLLRSVKRGAISGILPDQVPGELSAGVNSDFFGVPCFTGTLSSNMIQRSGALALFAYAKRIPGGFQVNYLPAEDAIYSEDIEVSVAALNRGVEQCVRECVEQYQWEYRRFRVRPKQAGPRHYDGVGG